VSSEARGFACPVMRDVLGNGLQWEAAVRLMSDGMASLKEVPSYEYLAVRPELVATDLASIRTTVGKDASGVGQVFDAIQADLLSADFGYGSEVVAKMAEIVDAAVTAAGVKKARYVGWPLCASRSTPVRTAIPVSKRFYHP
jgi:hypothetical protein